MEGADIIFPHLGITIDHLGKSVSIFGFSIAYYGIIIGIGMVLGIAWVIHEARRTGQNPDKYYDFALIAIILGVIGARIYYVVFEWDYYSQNPAQILNLRGGGLAIYGGVLSAIVTIFVFSCVNKMKVTVMMDTAVGGLLIGQIIGRWGNFCNREAFGGYTDGLFAMQIRMDQAAYTTPELVEKAVDVGGVSYIQVQPTFLYESMWNLMVFLIILIYKRHKKFDGELALIYLMGYGLGRFIIEGFRTDQLLLPVVGLPVSRVLSLCLMIIALIIFIINHVKLSRKGKSGDTAQN